MKKIILLLALPCLLISVNAQDGTPRKSKVSQAAASINQKSQKINEASNQVLNEAQQTAGNIQSTLNNAKAVIKIFEPILRLRLRKAPATTEAISAPNATPAGSTENTTSVYSNNPVPVTTPVSQEPATVNSTNYVTQNDINQGVKIIPESSVYNSDGTANLGSQNHSEYGCYIDVVRGAILDEVDAAGNSKSIDLIFTATNAFNEQVPMYAFLTPAYVKNDRFAYNFFKGTKYHDQNIPPASWSVVNESEVAMTSITGAQFEKIQNNNQLMAVVKQVRGFGQKVESRVKLDGKVIAVKTEMNGRQAYGLIYITNHFGTTGENGFLKIKIKVTGFDQTGDGIPDAGLYH